MLQTNPQNVVETVTWDRQGPDDLHGASNKIRTSAFDRALPYRPILWRPFPKPVPCDSKNH